MNKVVIFGGSGGLGKQISERLQSDMYVESLSSKDVDVTNFDEVKDFFHNNDVVVDSIINLSGYNHNMMLHKY